MDGRVDAILVPVGETVPVGSPLLRLEVESLEARRRPITQEDPGQPRLTRRVATASRSSSSPAQPWETAPALSACPAARDHRRGHRSPHQRKTWCAASPAALPDEILSRTGIACRRRLAPHESALTIAVEAARRSLDSEHMSIHEIDAALICCTTTPEGVTPSTACLILHALCKGGAAREIPAYDINAACSGYLYALAIAHDLAQTDPGARVLIVTTEAMSRLADPLADFETRGPVR